MALVYLREGMTAPATFSLFVRRLPDDRGFLVAHGLAQVLSRLEELCVRKADAAAFAAALGRPVSELEPLVGTRFTGDVWAVPEGRLVFAGEPLLEVTAPLPQAQLVETLLLNQLTYATAVASKAARCVLAAQGRPVVDFALRRVHGVEAGLTTARAAALVGFAGTSNVAASQLLGLPAVGTMAHSFVQAFGSEREAFSTFARDTSGPLTLLVDTYDTGRGVRLAAEVLQQESEERPIGVRLDSGDLGALAKDAREVLDRAGLARARIVASGGLDEHAVDELVRAGAPIDLFAVGTSVGTVADTPYLDSAYKLVAYDGRPVMKLSEGKVNPPAAKQVFRTGSDADVLGLRDETPPPGAAPVLEQVMAGGVRTAPRPSEPAAVADARRWFEADLRDLPPAARALRAPQPPVPVLSPRLRDLTEQLRRSLESQGS